MTQAYLPFYFEWADILGGLPDADYGRLVKAILAFSMGKDCDRDFSPVAEMAYKFITAAITRSEINRKNGQKGGIARVENIKKSGKAPTSEAKTEKKNGESHTNTRKNANNKDENPTNAHNSEKSSKNEENNACDAEKSTKNQPDGSIPTREQVTEFFKSREFRSNPEEFFNFYESNGWMVGQNPMKNWFSSAENWELRHARERNAGNSTGSAFTANSSDSAEPCRYGDFDIHEAFQLALKRSYEDDE